MPAHLQPLDDGVSLWLDKPILLIGRHPECDVQIESRKISRRHCCIAQVNEYLVIRDLGSTNGIRINGVRVVEGRLTPGDEVTIGNFRYQVNWGSCGEIPIPEKHTNGVRQTESVREEAPDFADVDAMLESCEIPIPLPDPEEESAVHQLREVSEPVESERLEKLEELEKPSSDVDPMSLIIPDVLELAGSKDNLPKGPSSPPEQNTEE